MTVNQEDLRPMASLTEAQLTDKLREVVEAYPYRDRRLQSNIDYIQTLLVELLKRRESKGLSNDYVSG